MLCEGHLSRYFWAKAINTACYILNRVLVRPILKKTSYELWKDRKPNISYFHVFGCRCFIHNNEKDNLGKFDSRTDEGIFLGYSTNFKAYRVFNKRTLIVEESIHVVFDELNTSSITKNLDNDEDLLETRINEIKLNNDKDLEEQSNNHEETVRESQESD